MVIFYFSQSEMEGNDIDLVALLTVYVTESNIQVNEKDELGNFR